MIGASSSANSLRTWLGIRSGPTALCGSIFSSNFRTSASVALILGIFFLAGPSHGIASVSSCVKTLIKWIYGNYLTTATLRGKTYVYSYNVRVTFFQLTMLDKNMQNDTLVTYVCVI